MSVALAAGAVLLAFAAPAPATDMAASSGVHKRTAIDDPLDHPALQVGRLESRPMLATAKAGDRLVAVGSRGLIIYSDDGAGSWRQSAVPVQSDLVAVHFPTALEGWAVGHDGVVLHSADGGKTWQKQFDGRLAKTAFKAHYEARRDAGDNAAEEALGAIEKNYAGGPNLPYLDVWFKDTNTGYVVGSFGTLASTIDGGKTWVPGIEHLDNPDMLNLNAVREIGGDLFIAAERGLVFKLDPKTGKFRKIETGYGGSLFGLIGSTRVLIAYGLRGTVFRSTDRGESWQAVTTPALATLSGGLYDAKTERFLLVNVAGELLVGDRMANEFTLRRGAPGARYSGISEATEREYLVTGMSGVQLVEAPAAGPKQEPR